MKNSTNQHWATISIFILLFALISASLLPGCTSEDEEVAGEGDLALYAGGGKALQEGFPHMEGDTEYAFVDGWTMQFTRYIVVFGNIALTKADGGGTEGEFSGPVILDLKKDNGANQEITVISNLPAKRFDIEFDVLKATSEADNRNADADIVSEMIKEGYSYWIEGYASKEGRTVDFLLRLSVETHYDQCINGKDQTQGIAIENNKTTGAFIYAHALHLFWDTLAAGDEDLRFDAWAAVAGEDDLVTEEELAQQDLNDLRDENGDPLLDENGNPVFYNSEGIPLDQLNLLKFVEYAARYGVHFNGVGLCVTDPLN